MASTYLASVYLGFFVGGALFGLIPMIVFFVKRHWGLGILSLVVCGLGAFVHPWVSIIAAVVFLVWSISTGKN